MRRGRSGAIGELVASPWNQVITLRNATTCYNEEPLFSPMENHDELYKNASVPFLEIRAGLLSLHFLHME